MDDARGALGEGGNRSGAAGAPPLVREIVVPVHNDQTDRNAGTGVEVAELVAGAGAVRDVGLVRAKPGLELARHLRPGNILS